MIFYKILLLFCFSFFGRDYAANYTKIEKAISQHQFQDAYDLSIKTIRSFEKCDHEIIYNALLLADSLDIFDDVEILSYELARRGGCKEALEAFTYYENYHNKIDSSWEKGHQFFLNNTYNDDYFSQLEEILVDDQGIREHRVKELVSQVDSINFLKFKKLYEQYGWCTDFKIGLDCYGGSARRVPNPYHFDVIFLHFSLRKYKGFKAIIEDAFQKGDLNFYEYGRYISQYGLELGNDLILNLNGKYYSYKFSESDLKEIERNRKAIGWPSVDTQISNFKFKKSKNSPFMVYSPWHSYPVSEKNLSKFYTKLDL